MHVQNRPRHSLLEALSLAISGENIAIIDLSQPVGKQSWTYKQLLKDIEQTAAGVTEKSIVVLAIPNSIEFVLAFLAVAFLGAINLPLNSQYTSEEFRDLIPKDCNAVIVNTRGCAPAEEIAQEYKRQILELTVGPKLSKKSGGGGNEKKNEDGGDTSISTCAVGTADHICLMLFTAGSTSKPKAVPLSQHNLAVSMSNIVATYKLDSNDITKIVMPFFHIHGLVAGLLSSLKAGSKIIIPINGKFSATTFWDDIFTWFTAVPTILQILADTAHINYEKNKNSKPSLRFIRSCSAPLPPALMTKLEQLFNSPVLEAYAMTEAAHQMTSNPLNGERRPGTVGLPQQVSIAILDNNCEEVPIGETGEVCVRGENVTKGYLNNPEANEIAFKGHWFHTGDLGFLSKDDGYLTIVGRIKEMINRGGEKISPIEIDNVILSHPKVIEAVTFALPDTKYGECVCVAIIKKKEENLEDNLTEEELIKFCSKKLAQFKIPKYIFFTDMIPRTPTGKVIRRLMPNHFNV